MDVTDGSEMQHPMEGINIVERHETAMRMKKEVQNWAKKNGHLIEMGIGYRDRRLKIYIPPGTSGEAIRKGLQASSIEGINDEADFKELKRGNLKRLAMHPGRTPIYFGDGSSATLGTFLQDRNHQILYALTSEHTSIDIMHRDVFVKVGDSVYRLGRVVANSKEPSPVVEACLIKVDIENQEMYDQIRQATGMYFNDPYPPIYLKMHQNAETLCNEGVDPLKVSMYGYSTKGTHGYIIEYSRDIEVNGRLLTDNIVTVSENTDVQFAAAGDSGSVLFRSIRSNEGNVYYFDAISMLYMADDATGESFSIPLPRCLRRLEAQINNAHLELATQPPPFFPIPNP